MKRVIYLSTLAVIMSGCAKIEVRDDLSSEQLNTLNEIERYYINSAKSAASAKSNCPVEKIKTIRAAQGNEHSVSVGVLPSYVGNDVLEVVGVDACGSRSAYTIVCTGRQSYDDKECGVELEG